MLRRPVPHALYTADGTEVCLIVKDHKGAHMTAGFGSVRRVISNLRHTQNFLAQWWNVLLAV